MLSEDITLKQLCLNKGLETPDESGIITFQLEASLKKVKSQSIKDMIPTAEEMALISEYAMVEQDPSNFLMLRNVDPIGDPKAVDSQLDMFSKQAEKNLVEGAPGTPLLINHDHDIANPPVGFVISSRLTNKGPRETIAIPLDNGNDAVVKGLLNGSINKLSVGIQVYLADTLCNSCEKETSIYSFACPHTPGQLDEKGNKTTKTINKVARYLERSLVNVPARLGTSTKSEGPTFRPIVAEDLPVALEDDHPTFGSGISITNGSNSVVIESTSAETNTSDTITFVNDTPIEDSTVAEDQKEVKAEEVAVAAVEAETEVKAEEVVETPPAVVEEVKAEAEAVLETKELKVSLSDESNEVIKSLTAASAETSDKVNKLLEVVTKQEDLIAKLSSQLEASAKSIEALVDLQKALTETVDKAVGVTTEDVLTKFMEVAKAASEQKKAMAPAKGDLLTHFGV